MKIRKSTIADLPQIQAIYADARKLMKESGNPTQWKNNHPPQETVEADIKNGNSYVCFDQNDNILAVFFFTTQPDPTYTEIRGAWLNDQPYGVIHRIARRNIPIAKGMGAFCINWCFSQIQNLRIDTHEDNAPMLTMLAREGFVRCGMIKLANGEDRVALQKI